MRRVSEACSAHAVAVVVIAANELAVSIDGTFPLLSIIKTVHVERGPERSKVDAAVREQ